ncbi:hypothetical protein [Prosthecobacter sp.]|uniref:hypothetical protein n=1 Tax=Prosthecobacter sp. TaxID=1965333 RepID=UPI002AB8770B|nr:hypothetical protein [Prosthecobacter sp.]MDZ4403745.1 hypothetical protein [Prosthecobacter sp.]
MTRAKFEQALRGASEASRQFALTVVTNDLPTDYRYVVYLNQSFDESPLEADVTVYPDDPLGVGDLGSPLSTVEVVQLLCRDDAVPEWVDISAYRVTDRFTVFSLHCCGRFTSNIERLYYGDSDLCPFGIKSPVFPPRWKEAQGRFDLNTTRSHEPQ